MAITSADIQQQSFKIDRRGYDVDEVDIFLEHVANEIDLLNDEVAHLHLQLEDAGGSQAAYAEPVYSGGFSGDTEGDMVDSSILAEKDARIAELEAQLKERKNEDSTIAQALIIAQRTGDEIVTKARSDGEDIRRAAEEEARRILDKANAEKQKVIDQINDLSVSREKVREQYQEMLKGFISTSTKFLSEIGGENTSDFVIPEELLNNTIGEDDEVAVEEKWAPSPSTATYTTPTVNPVSSMPTPPTPSQAAKDLSGYGDADESFDFDDID